MSELTLLKIFRSGAPDCSAGGNDSLETSDSSQVQSDELTRLLCSQMEEYSYSAISRKTTDMSFTPEAQELILNSVANLVLPHERVMSEELFAVRAWFAKHFGSDCAVALGKREQELVVVVFSEADQPAVCCGRPVVTCPLGCLDDFAKLAIIKGANSAIVCHVPFSEFGLSGGYPGPLCLKVKSNSVEPGSEVRSVLGLTVVNAL